MAGDISGFSITLPIEKVAKLFLDRLDKWGNKDQRRLSELLKEIVELFEAVESELKKGEVPYRNGNALATLINSAARIVEKPKKRDLKLWLIFEHDLPKVGRLLRTADFFIDGKPRDSHHYDLAAREGTTKVDTKDAAIAEACTEIERVIGILSGYSLGLDNANSKKPSKRTSKASQKIRRAGRRAGS
jgi:hypothetical protein